MDGHGQAEKEASEVLRSFNILGAPRSTQVCYPHYFYSFPTSHSCQLTISLHRIRIQAQKIRVNIGFRIVLRKIEDIDVLIFVYGSCYFKFFSLILLGSIIFLCFLYITFCSSNTYLWAVYEFQSFSFRFLSWSLKATRGAHLFLNSVNKLLAMIALQLFWKIIIYRFIAFTNFSLMSSASLFPIFY